VFRLFREYRCPGTGNRCVHLPPAVTAAGTPTGTASGRQARRRTRSWKGEEFCRDMHRAALNSGHKMHNGVLERMDQQRQQQAPGRSRPIAQRARRRRSLSILYLPRIPGDNDHREDGSEWRRRHAGCRRINERAVSRPDRYAPCCSSSKRRSIAESSSSSKKGLDRAWRSSSSVGKAQAERARQQV
jgi:hypothetical protein